MPRFIAIAASRTCAPSCRSRSTWRSSATESSTSAGPGLLQVTDPLREGAGAEQRPRTSQRSAVTTPLVSQGAMSSSAAPKTATSRLPPQLVACTKLLNGGGVAADTG